MRPSSDTVEALLRGAALAVQAGRSADQAAFLDRALAMYPADPRVQNSVGMRAMTKGDYDLAIASFGKAMAADPRELALHINLATAYRGKRDNDGERQALRGALDIDQRSFIAQLRMAELWQRQGRLSEAARHWSAVVQLADATAEAPPAMIDAARRGRAMLEEHGRIFAATLDHEFAQPAHQQQRRSRRFQACVDSMLGRRRIYRNECAGIYFPFLPAEEYFDRDLFPWFTALEARTDAIAAEAIALIGSADASIRPYVRQEAGTPQNKWSTLDQSLEWSACFLWEYGEPNEPVCARCPDTVAALREVPQTRIPGKAPSAFFSILRPGAHIPAHTGVTNARTIIHLPLVVPDGCRFRVGGETRPWRVGEAFAFDDTIEHEAWNDSDALRIVLIFDVWNPYLTPEEQDDLATLFTVADRGLLNEAR